ncbi:MAG: hypothetical protein J0L84_05845 [Verrucomicrobia bacterium]|nr:hypothetical protein [Verrucomicrobiota bacterium]
MKLRRPWSAWLVPGVLCLTVAGCVSPPRPVDTSAPGWQVTEAPAVWRPGRDAPELAGDLWIATHADGSRVVQFLKQGLPVVVVQVSGGTWSLSSPMRSGRPAGRMPAPPRSVWLVLDGSPPGAPPTPWERMVGDPAGGWTLRNPQTGETLECAAPEMP